MQFKFNGWWYFKVGNLYYRENSQRIEQIFEEDFYSARDTWFKTIKEKSK